MEDYELLFPSDLNASADSLGPPAVPQDLPPAPPAPPPPRFCGTCGTAWDVLWKVCPFCTAPVAQRVAGSERHSKPVVSAITCYFLLLAVSVIGIISITLGGGELAVESFLEIADSILVIVWCIVCWKEISPVLSARFNLLWLAAAAAAGGVTFLIATACLTFLHTFLHVPLAQYTPQFTKAGYGMPVVILSICIQPAIIEELAFRGIIFQGLRSALSGPETVIVSAMMFMILHLAPVSFPHLFVLGLAVGLLRFRTGSVVPGMFLHFTHNLLCIIFENWNG